MSLLIDVDLVTRVLLADGWHDVHAQSFLLDAYEYAFANEAQRKEGDFSLVHGGGSGGVCPTGFSFDEVVGGSPEGDLTRRVFGPLTSILAVEGESL